MMTLISTDWNSDEHFIIVEGLSFVGHRQFCNECVL